jgi:rare lipoprotein A
MQVGQRRAEAARALALVGAALAVAGAVVLGCASDAEARRPAHPVKQVQKGHASYYGAEFDGRKTASGERYDPRKLTAAHKTLPLGTWVRVTRLEQGADGPSVEVKVNDRCGCTHGRIIDLSRSAAMHLHMLNAGVIPVRLEVIHR